MPSRTTIEPALRHFRAFAGVIEAGGVTAASDRLRRSPSSVSRSVAILEGVLGATLLNRAPVGLTPTPVGDLVAARIAAIRAELDACRAALMRNHRAALRENAALFEMQPDLVHLRALIAVHDFRSVQRAADLMGVSQPAVSYSIRLLESDLGVELFQRVRSGMVPTAAGQTVTVCARRILSEISKLFDDVRSADGVSTGLVRVGGLPYSRSVVLPEAIKLVLARNPAVSVRTVEGPIEAMMTALHGDEIDAVICAHPDRAFLDGVTVEPIAEDPLGFFVAREHPLAGQRAVALEALLAHSFILPPLGSITRHLLVEFFRKAGLHAPPGRVETSSSSLIRNLLLESDFIAFRSLREFTLQIGDERIVPLDIAGALPSRTICVLRRQGVRPTSAIEHFLHAVRRAGLSPRGAAREDAA